MADWLRAIVPCVLLRAASTGSSLTAARWLANVNVNDNSGSRCPFHSDAAVPQHPDGLWDGRHGRSWGSPSMRFERHHEPAPLHARTSVRPRARGALVPLPLAGIGASAVIACVADSRVSGRSAAAGLRRYGCVAPAAAPRWGRQHPLPVCTRGGGGSPLLFAPGGGFAPVAGVDRPRHAAGSPCCGCKAPLRVHLPATGCRKHPRSRCKAPPDPVPAMDCEQAAVLSGRLLDGFGDRDRPGKRLIQGEP